MLYTLLATDLHYCFSLAFTIGWEEWGVIATVGAVIVALWANIGAKKQLKSALKMQEQSKNVSLLEQRVNVAEMIRADEEPSSVAMHVLFSEEICNIYNVLCQARQCLNEALNDEQEFFFASQTDVDAGHENEIKSKILEYEDYMSRPNCPDSIIKQYQDFCNKHTIFWSPTGLSDDRQEYNYAEISKRISSSQSAISEAKDKILKAIETYVADSIAPVDKKQKRRGKL